MHFVIVPPGVLSPRNNPVVDGDFLSRFVSLKIFLFKTRGSRRRHLNFISHYIYNAATL